MTRIVALGAETQAASSLALANPGRDILLVSDETVLDGWDLAHVRFQAATPVGWPALVSRDDLVVPLCSRWLPAENWSLSRTLRIAAETIGADRVLPVARQVSSAGIWQAKGDRWHRPDMPVYGPASEIRDTGDLHGCGLVFQERVDISATILTMGRFGPDGASLGVFRVFEERFFRQVILQAAESTDDPEIVERSIHLASRFAHDGFLTFNWVVTGGRRCLTSIRPAPRAAFGLFRRGGIDLLEAPAGTTVLRAGLRLVAQPHYSSYKRLEA
jgi:hypothetical protein